MVTFDDFINSLDIQLRPSEEDGWYAFTVIFETMKEKGVKQETLRHHLGEKVDLGMMERVRFGKDTYYRIVVK